MRCRNVFIGDKVAGIPPISTEFKLSGWPVDEWTKCAIGVVQIDGVIFYWRRSLSKSMTFQKYNLLSWRKLKVFWQVV